MGTMDRGGDGGGVMGRTLNQRANQARFRPFLLVDGLSELTCWLEDDPRLKVGVSVTLKQTGSRVWRIVTRGQVILDHRSPLDWKVGGLQ